MFVNVTVGMHVLLPQRGSFILSCAVLVHFITCMVWRQLQLAVRDALSAMDKVDGQATSSAITQLRRQSAEASASDTKHREAILKSIVEWSSANPPAVTLLPGVDASVSSCCQHRFPVHSEWVHRLWVPLQRAFAKGKRQQARRSAVDIGLLKTLAGAWNNLHRPLMASDLPELPEAEYPQVTFQYAFTLLEGLSLLLFCLGKVVCPFWHAAADFGNSVLRGASRNQGLLSLCGDFDCVNVVV
jgi:hypothetical protein